MIGAAGRRNLQTYAEDLISAVKIALCDSSQEVRESAATAFNLLHKQVGQEVMNIIFPALLQMLEEGDHSVDVLSSSFCTALTRAAETPSPLVSRSLFLIFLRLCFFFCWKLYIFTLGVATLVGLGATLWPR